MRKSLNNIQVIFLPLLLLVATVMLSACQPQVSSISANQVEEKDYGCAYFYFLWGRQAELEQRFEEALEAYEKALICDPGTEYIVRKIPVLLLRMDRGDEAVSMLQDFLKKQPKDQGMRMLLARIYIGLGKYGEAADQYMLIHRQNPEEESSLLLLSELFVNQNKLQEAEKVIRQLLAANPDSYPAHVLLARIYLERKEYDAAEKEYQKALEIEWSADLVIEMSEIYVLREEYNRLISQYREVLEREPQNEFVSLALINFLLLQDREEEALVELNRLKAQVEEPGRVDLSIARLYARLEKYDKSIKILRGFLETNNSADARYLLAVILAQSEQYEQALKELRLIPREAEDYEDVVVFQVRILRFLDRTEQAVEVLEKAIQYKESRSPDMYVMLAALYQIQNKTDLGKSTFNRGLSAFPDDNELLYEYGQYLDTLGSKDEAMSIMQEVIKRQPEHGDALNYVGYSWAEKSIHLDKALVYIQRAVKLNPESAYMHDSLGWVYYKLGRLEEARDTLEKAVYLSGDEPDPVIFDHLGDVYLELGLKKRALKAYEKAYFLFDEEGEAKESLRDKIQLLKDQDKQQ